MTETAPLSTAAKWGLGIAGSVATAVIIAVIFGGLDMRDKVTALATQMHAVQVSLDKITNDLANRPRYDANQAETKAAAQAVTDAAQNKLVELLSNNVEAMNKQQVAFDARLRVLEERKP